MFEKIRHALSKFQSATTPLRTGSAFVAEEDLTPPNGDAFLRQGLALALGPESAREVLAELDYAAEVARKERLVKLRERELAANADLSRLS